MGGHFPGCYAGAVSGRSGRPNRVEAAFTAARTDWEQITHWRWQSGGDRPFPPHAVFAKSLNSKDGRVAEWFKAPVLKF